MGWFQAAFRSRWRLPTRCWCDAPRWIRVAWLMGAPSQDSQGLDEKIHPGTSGGGVQQGDKTRRGSSHDLAQDCLLGFLVRTLVTYLSYLVFACICRWSHLPKLGTSQLSAWFIKQKAPPMQRFFQRWAVILSAIFQMSLVPSTEWKSLTGTTAMLARSFRCFFLSFPASAGNWLQVPNERRVVFSLILFSFPVWMS